LQNISELTVKPSVDDEDSKTEKTSKRSTPMVKLDRALLKLNKNRRMIKPETTESNNEPPKTEAKVVSRTDLKMAEKPVEQVETGKVKEIKRTGKMDVNGLIGKFLQVRTSLGSAGSK
jgi:hypothetical protein